MDTEASTGNWGDPYIGLRLLEREISGYTLRAMENARVWSGMRQISGADPGVFDDIARFLRDLLDRISPWRMFPWLEAQVFAPLKGWLGAYFVQPLIGTLWAIQGALSSRIENILERLRSTVGNLAAWIGPWLISAAYIVGNVISNPIQSVRTVIDLALLGLRAVVGMIPVQIRDSIREAWQGMTAAWGFAADRILAALTSWRLMFDAGLASVLALIRNQGGERQTFWNRFLETWPGQLLTSVTGALSALWQMIITSLREWWTRWRPVVMDAAQEVIDFARPTVESWVSGFKELPATYLNWVAATAGTDLALHPSRALATTGSLYAMAIAAGTSAMTLSTVLNIIPTTNWVGMSQFSAFIAEAAGFEPLTRATYGVLLNDALAWPLRYHWNRQLRPKMPTEGTIFLMGRKRGLDRAEFGNAMALHGIPDSWTDKIYQFFWTDPSPYWLLRMSEHANPMIKPSALFLPWLDKWLPEWRGDPWAWFKMKLKLAGFEDTDIPAFIEGFQRRQVSGAVTQLKTSVRAMIRDGYWNRDHVEEALRPLHVRQEEIELIMVAEELDYLKGYLDDEVRYYNESFRKGVMGGQDLELALSTLIVKPERVAQIVARERVRALKKPKPIVAAKEDPLVTRLRRQAIDSWTKRYRAWEISEKDLLLGLTIVVEDHELAKEMVSAEVTRYRPPPKPPVPPKVDPIVAASRRSAIASWVKLFRDGEITSDELDLRLSPLIEDAEIVRQIKALEELRARPAPEILPPVEEDPVLARIRAEKVRGHLQMFRKRLIGLGQLYTYLVADGLVRELSRATVITEANKRIKVAPLESPYYLRDQMRELIDQGLEAYEQRYIEGKITIDTYITWLTSIGVDPDLSTYLADILSLRSFLEGRVS